MKRRLKEPFGKAGLTVAIIALAFALVGGAYAAGGLTKSQEKQVVKIAKKFAGKPGVTGPAGSQGTPGPAGKDGAPGADGTNGVNVTSKAIPTSSTTCNHQGGTELTSVSGTEHLCNGQTGYTEVLPHEKTLVGDWSIVENVTGAFKVAATSASFAIPLETAPEPHYIRTTGKEPFYNGTEEGERAQPACPGSAAEPGAEPGNLCIYASSEEGPAIKNSGTLVLPKVCAFGTAGTCIGLAPAADTSGFGLSTISSEEGRISLTGTWAVTAE